MDDSIIFARAKMSDCEALKMILTTYEVASSQQVNMAKSTITFSPNVTMVDMRDVQGMLGLVDVQYHDEYLGLPSVIRRNKKKLFLDIKELVWKPAQGWRSNIFSIGECEILIKAMLQAISSYVMSIFKLLVSLCDDLRSRFFFFFFFF